MKWNNIIKGKEGQEINRREINLINNGTIEGLVRISVERKNDNFRLYYQTSGLIDLQEILKTNLMSKRLFVVILRSITIVLKNIEGNKLNRDLIVWDLNAVYVNPSDWQTYLAYVPLQPYETVGTLKNFLLQLISECSFVSAENPEYVQQLVEDLNSGTSYSVNSLEGYCNRISQQLVGVSAAKMSELLCPKCSAKLMPHEIKCPYCGEKTGEQSYQKHSDGTQRAFADDNNAKNNQCAQDIFFKKDRDIPANENENRVITVFTGTAAPSQTVWIEDLERVGKILITRFPFRLGKMKEAVDYQVLNNRVSRKHAEIIKEQGKYYIVDLGSTNGTCVFGKRVQAGEKVPLNDNTEIRLADAGFRFHID